MIKKNTYINDKKKKKIKRKEIMRERNTRIIRVANIS